MATPGWGVLCRWNGGCGGYRRARLVVMAGGARSDVCDCNPATAFFVLAHDAAHYRLFASRGLNDWVGGLLASAVGISMRSYRLYRLHHNDLYGQSDPDIPLSAGYPRGRMYLLKKLGRDLLGATAPKRTHTFSERPP